MDRTARGEEGAISGTNRQAEDKDHQGKQDQPRPRKPRKRKVATEFLRVQVRASRRQRSKRAIKDTKTQTTIKIRTLKKVPKDKNQF